MPLNWEKMGFYSCPHQDGLMPEKHGFLLRRAECRLREVSLPDSVSTWVHLGPAGLRERRPAAVALAHLARHCGQIPLKVPPKKEQTDRFPFACDLAPARGSVCQTRSCVVQWKQRVSLT